MRTLLLFLIGWLLSGCAESLAGLPKSPAVMLLNDAGRPVCGAVAVAPHRLLTAAHCVGWGDQTTKKYVTDTRWHTFVYSYSTATVVRVLASKDLAWLDTPAADAPLPFLRVRDAVEGEAVYATAPAFEWTVHPGLIAGGEAGFLFSSLSIQPGWSGSPVIASDGKLVGIVSACIDVSTLSGTGLHSKCASDFAILATPGNLVQPTASENLRDNGAADNGSGAGTP